MVRPDALESDASPVWTVLVANSVREELSALAHKTGIRAIPPRLQRSGVARSIFHPSGCVRKGLAAAGGRIVRRRPGEGGELPTRRPALSRPSDETLVKVGCGAINHHKLEARNIEGAKLRSCCFSAIGVRRRSPLRRSQVRITPKGLICADVPHGGPASANGPY